MVSSYFLNSQSQLSAQYRVFAIECGKYRAVACKVLLAYRSLLLMLHLDGSKTEGLRQKRVVDFIVLGRRQLLWQRIIGL